MQALCPSYVHGGSVGALILGWLITAALVWKELSACKQHRRRLRERTGYHRAVRARSCSRERFAPKAPIKASDEEEPSWDNSYTGAENLRPDSAFRASWANSDTDRPSPSLRSEPVAPKPSRQSGKVRMKIALEHANDAEPLGVGLIFPTA